MYGDLVGKASARIEKGGLLSTANVKHDSDKLTCNTETLGLNSPNFDKWIVRTWQGYHRADGKV